VAVRFMTRVKIEPSDWLLCAHAIGLWVAALISSILVTVGMLFDAAIVLGGIISTEAV
jgi:hypothetical protein